VPHEVDGIATLAARGTDHDPPFTENGHSFGYRRTGCHRPLACTRGLQYA
jgi:hypothetical protein